MPAAPTAVPRTARRRGAPTEPGRQEQPARQGARPSPPVGPQPERPRPRRRPRPRPYNVPRRPGPVPGLVAVWYPVRYADRLRHRERHLRRPGRLGFPVAPVPWCSGQCRNPGWWARRRCPRRSGSAWLRGSRRRCSGPPAPCQRPPCSTGHRCERLVGATQRGLRRLYEAVDAWLTDDNCPCGPARCLLDSPNFLDSVGTAAPRECVTGNTHGCHRTTRPSRICADSTSSSSSRASRDRPYECRRARHAPRSPRAALGSSAARDLDTRTPTPGVREAVPRSSLRCLDPTPSRSRRPCRPASRLRARSAAAGTRHTRRSAPDRSPHPCAPAARRRRFPRSHAPDDAQRHPRRTAFLHSERAHASPVGRTPPSGRPDSPDSPDSHGATDATYVTDSALEVDDPSAANTPSAPDEFREPHPQSSRSPQRNPRRSARSPAGTALLGRASRTSRTPRISRTHHHRHRTHHHHHAHQPRRAPSPAHGPAGRQPDVPSRVLARLSPADATATAASSERPPAPYSATEPPRRPLPSHAEREEAPPTYTAVDFDPRSLTQGQIDELTHKMAGPITRLLRTELRLERERIGKLRDPRR